jgi:hypothetical protein
MVYFIISSLAIAAFAAALIFALLERSPVALGDEGAPASGGNVYCNAQLYWRDIAQARDWDGLKAQLRRWQQLSNPGWDEQQVEEVARALNAAVFRFAEPGIGRA